LVRRSFQRPGGKVDTGVSREQFVSYAQNYEDVVLARAFHPDRESGFWIDVGAGDPVSESVTAAFSDRGWSGINIEPLAREYEQLRAARPIDTNLCVALGATSGIATLFQGPERDRGASTMRSDIVASRGAEADEFTAVEVPVCTLTEIVSEYVSGTVDFLKIDVEGLEHEVLMGADFTRFRPRALVIEATIPNTTKPSHELWEPLLLDAGYRCTMFDGLNRFYASEDEPDLLDALAIPANVFDQYVPYRWIRELGEATTYAEGLTLQVGRLRADYESAQTALESAHAESIRIQTESLQTQAELARLHGEMMRVEDDAALAWRTARYGQDEARIAEENTAVLQQELAAAQMRSARALADVVSAGDELLAARADIDTSRGALEALEATRTFRYTASMRARYAMLRKLLHLS
jgi:FkbM family methyltransferase